MCFFEPGRHFLSCLHLKGGKTVFPLGQIIKGKTSGWKKSVTGVSIQLYRAPEEGLEEFGSVWALSSIADHSGLRAFWCRGWYRGSL